MSLSPSADTDRMPRPYGPVGLVLSLAAILVVTTIFCVIEGAAAVGLLAALQGWKAALVSARGLVGLDDHVALAPERAEVVLGAGVYVANIAAVFVMAAIRGSRQWTSLVAWCGWPMRRHWRFFAAILLPAILWGFGASVVIEHFHPEAKDWVVAPKQAGWLIAFAGLVVLVGPFAEEVLFRGWIYTSLRASFGTIAAVLLSSVVFALAHWENTHLYALAVFPVGIGLALVRERTGGIGPSFLFHALYNSSALVLSLYDF